MLTSLILISVAKEFSITDDARRKKVDIELKLLSGISRLLPPLPRFGAIGNILKRIYLRKKRKPIETTILGYKMTLDPNEYVEAEILFIPQLYDYREILFLKNNLRDGDCFIDVGTHVGLYSLAASSSVGARGRILAIEANPNTHRKLELTLRQNGIRNITAVNIGAADRPGTLRLGLNTAGNSGGDSFVLSYKDGIDVNCLPLRDILASHGIDKVQGMKFDIEGFEFKVLDKFFRDAPPSLHPQFIIIEFHPKFVELAGGNSLEVIEGNGYHEELRHASNVIYRKTALPETRH